MAAMMPSGTASANPYEHYDQDPLEDDLIDPDDDPLASSSDRAPLTGNIQQPSARAQNTQSYLNNTIGGEDRRAPQNTIDESVWDTLSRDLLAIWEKMRQVLYPKYLLGGLLQRGGGMGGAERAEGDSLGGGGLNGLVGRWPDADTVLQSGMSEGLRDWDLCFLLSRGAQDEQKSVVFSGVFATVWIGEAVVTLQIKLLGGSM
ncbi:unnamed protein product [Aureobasidium pullulans]|nr:unnamed protein product [Aureobasidium pullulans]